MRWEQLVLPPIISEMPGQLSMKHPPQGPGSVSGSGRTTGLGPAMKGGGLPEPWSQGQEYWGVRGAGLASSRPFLVEEFVKGFHPPH